MTSTVVQYGVQCAGDTRPAGPFGSYRAAEIYIDLRPHLDQPTIVERIILTGDWYPAERPTP